MTDPKVQQCGRTWSYHLWDTHYEGRWQILVSDHAGTGLGLEPGDGSQSVQEELASPSGESKLFLGSAAFVPHGDPSVMPGPTWDRGVTQKSMAVAKNFGMQD